ncbi:MAG: copper amine oxidase N-terminal domain-containing protein, partial [Candidatus Cybelea sp.]
MKRLSTGMLVALMFACCGLSAVAAPSPAASGNNGNGVAQAGGAPPADFGTPPSGQIPILFNDHHVYTKPDLLKQGRVLGAIVRNGTLLIPLRSMFEQMGATVSWDDGSKTATVSKPGAEVKVTVGKPEVVINGESRPLDVPPMVYQGVVVVPVRVISEGMGAYVQWVPDRRLVVVRYIPATPPPSPAPPPPDAPP